MGQSFEFSIFLNLPGVHRIWKISFLNYLARLQVVSERFYWKDDRYNIKVFVSCPEQPSVLENVYRLHYSFLRGKGRDILRVSFSLMLLFIFTLCSKMSP